MPNSSVELRIDFSRIGIVIEIDKIRNLPDPSLIFKHRSLGSQVVIPYFKQQGQRKNVVYRYARQTCLIQKPVKVTKLLNFDRMLFWPGMSKKHILRVIIFVVSRGLSNDLSLDRADITKIKVYSICLLCKRGRKILSPPQKIYF